MFGDYLNIAITIVVVFLIVKMFLKGVIPGVVGSIWVIFMFTVKLILSILVMPIGLIIGLVKMILLPNKKEKPVRLFRETVVITRDFIK